MWLLISDAMLNICSQNFELTLNIPFCWTRCGSRESRSPSCVIKSLLFLFFFTFGTTMRMLAITTRMLTITSTWMTDWSLVCSTDPIWQASELLPTRSSRKLSFEGSSGRAIDLRKKVQSTFSGDPEFWGTCSCSFPHHGRTTWRTDLQKRRWWRSCLEWICHFRRTFVLGKRKPPIPISISLPMATKSAPFRLLT